MEHLLAKAADRGALGKYLYVTVFYVRHPKCEVVYPVFQIPRWDETAAVVTELARVVPANHCVGWDIALTDEGRIMFEGNPRGQLLAQYVTRKGIKEKLESYISQM